MKLFYLLLFLSLSCAPKMEIADLPTECESGRSVIAVWVWDPLTVKDNTDRVEKLIREWGIRRVYLAASPGDLRTVVNFFKDLNVEVFIVESSKEISGRFTPGVVRKTGADGYQIDLEPYWDMTLSEFGKIAPAYLQVIRELRERAGKTTFSVAIPHWFDRISVGRRNLAQKVMETADEVVVMAYSPSFKRSLRLSKEEVGIGEKLGRKVLIGLEATAYLSSDTEPMSLRDLRVVKEIRCRGVEGFVINSLDALF